LHLEQPCFLLSLAISSLQIKISSTNVSLHTPNHTFTLLTCAGSLAVTAYHYYTLPLSSISFRGREVRLSTK
jgi:hypothetical protein